MPASEEDDRYILRRDYEPKHTELMVRLTQVEGNNRNLEEKIKALEQRMEDRFKAADAAVEKHDEANNIRLDAMNELRDQINRERGAYALKDQLSTVTDALRAEFRALSDKNATAIHNLEGRADFGSGKDKGYGNIVYYIVSVAAIVIAMVAIFMGR